MGRTRGERGQAIVETVLMLPFIFMLIFTIAEFGFAFYSHVTVNNATAEAARFAAVGRLPSDTCEANSIQWRAQQMSRGLVACDDVTVTYGINEGDTPERGTGITVNVSRTYTAVTPMPALISFVTGGAFPTSWPMTACSDARLESNLGAGTYPADPDITDCGD